MDVEVASKEITEASIAAVEDEELPLGEDADDDDEDEGEDEDCEELVDGCTVVLVELIGVEAPTVVWLIAA